MARKPRMGRNLNALLNSAVKDRRERSDEPPEDERASGSPPSEETAPRAVEPTGDGAPADARVASPRADGSSVTPLVPGAAPAAGPAGGSGADVRADVSSVLPIKPDAPFARSRSDAEPPRGPVTDAAADGDSGREPVSGSGTGRSGAAAPSDAAGAPDVVRPGAGSSDAAGSSGVAPSGTVPADAGRPDDAPADGAPSGAVPMTRRAADAREAREADPAAAPSAPEPSVARIVRGDVDELPVAPGDPPRPGDRLRMIGVERIRRGVFQPRRFFDQEALQELADSLKAQGMIQPIIVRPFGGAFELIAGERRWRAAQIAGLTEIPAIVREMEDRTVAAVSLIENIQREDLNPLEEAQALTRLCDEFGMTHASVAESIGRSRASVSNLMRLLDLHDEVKVLVDKGELDMGHARALLRVPKVDQPALALRVAKQGLTVRAVEKLIRTGTDKGSGETPAATRTADPDVRRLEERLSGVLGAPVAIHQKAGGAGRLEIRYTSLDELEGILEHIK